MGPHVNSNGRAFADISQFDRDCNGNPLAIDSERTNQSQAGGYPRPLGESKVLGRLFARRSHLVESPESGIYTTPADYYQKSCENSCRYCGPCD